MQGPAATGNQADSASGRRSNSPHTPAISTSEAAATSPTPRADLCASRKAFDFTAARLTTTWPFESEKGVFRQASANTTLRLGFNSRGMSLMRATATRIQARLPDDKRLSFQQQFVWDKVGRAAGRFQIRELMAAMQRLLEINRILYPTRKSPPARRSPRSRRRSTSPPRRQDRDQCPETQPGLSTSSWTRSSTRPTGRRG